MIRWMDGFLYQRKGEINSVFRTGEVFGNSSFKSANNNNKANNPIFAYEDGKLMINLNRNNLRSCKE